MDHWENLLNIDTNTNTNTYTNTKKRGLGLIINSHRRRGCFPVSTFDGWFTGKTSRISIQILYLSLSLYLSLPLLQQIANCANPSTLHLVPHIDPKRFFWCSAYRSKGFLVLIRHIDPKALLVSHTRIQKDCSDYHLLLQPMDRLDRPESSVIVAGKKCPAESSGLSIQLFGRPRTDHYDSFI